MIIVWWRLQVVCILVHCLGGIVAKKGTHHCRALQNIGIRRQFFACDRGCYLGVFFARSVLVSLIANSVDDLVGRQCNWCACFVFALVVIFKCYRSIYEESFFDFISYTTRITFLTISGGIISCPAFL